MSFTWKHGIIIASCLTIGVAGAAILASSTPTTSVRLATVASDDPWDMPVPPSINVPVNAAVPANVAPAATNTAAPPVEEPLALDVQPLDTFVCKNRNGDARKPIQCDGRKTTHAWLTVSLKKRLPTPATMTLEEYGQSVGADSPRATGRYVRISSDMDVRLAKGAMVRITYTPAELRAWNTSARKLAIAAYDAGADRWLVLPSIVNQRSTFVQAAFAPKRLTDQYFALVTKP